MELSALNLHVPFDFYGTGAVRLLNSAADLEAGEFGVLFLLNSLDLKALLIFSFSSVHDTDWALEMGNVLASKIATQMDALISPPTFISKQRLLSVWNAPRSPHSNMMLQFGHEAASPSVFGLRINLE